MFQCPTNGYIWHYFTYFFVLAGVELIFMILFIVCQRKIRMIKLNRQHLERDGFLQQSIEDSIAQ